MCVVAQKQPITQSNLSNHSFVNKDKDFPSYVESTETNDIIHVFEGGWYGAHMSLYMYVCVCVYPSDL